MLPLLLFFNFSVIVFASVGVTGIIFVVGGVDDVVFGSHLTPRQQGQSIKVLMRIA